jgi:Ca2+-binding RTX toxin-like protein
VGEDTQSTWTLGGTQVYDDGTGRKLGLSGFTILQGGAAADRFQVRSHTEASLAGGEGDDSVSISPGAQLIGSIDGQDGRNAIDFAAFSTPVRVDLSAGTATHVDAGVTNIQLATGGSGDDTLIGGDSADELDGGPGDDALVGSGGDALNGGPGNDAFFLSRAPGTS